MPSDWFSTEQLQAYIPWLLIALCGLFLLAIMLLWLSARRQRRNIEALVAGNRSLTQTIQEHRLLQEKFQEYSHGQQNQLGKTIQSNSEQFIERLGRNSLEQQEAVARFKVEQTESFGNLRKSLEQRFGESALQQKDATSAFVKETFTKLEQVQKSVAEVLADGQMRQQRNLTEFKEQIFASLAENMQGLTKSTDERLKEISGQVEKRLADGFEKTTKTFTDVLQRLALIDEAQKKITELSTNVVSLQELLADKRSRGAYGEVQLAALVENVMPQSHFALQHTLSNGKIVDCALFLPEPTGTIGIDAKFPLESYQKMMDLDAGEHERKQASSQFSRDIKKHIDDISSKYIIPKETAAGAVMFVPAEAVFAEIHAHYAQLVDYAQQKKVWITSPTTLVAILTTASAVIKDEATREQVHLIQEHLGFLAKDFARFRERMNKLTNQIETVSKTATLVNTSAGKISSRFVKIEKVELDDEPTAIELDQPEIQSFSEDDKD